MTAAASAEVDTDAVAHTVHLHTADGVTLDLEVGAGRSVIEAAADAGHVLPSQCGQGTCGSCHAQARGAYTLGDHGADALPPGAAERGGVLLCRTYVEGEVDVDVTYPRSRIIDGGVGRREGTVLSATEVGHGMVWLRLGLEPDEVTGAGVEFEPGQFAELELPGDARRRAYSMANVPNWDGEVEFLIRLHDGGYFSAFLADLLAGRRPLGARVVVNGPLGAFGLRESGLRPRVFVAGGTGLAPVLSLIRRMAEFGDPQPARLILGVNTEADLPTLPELDEAASLLPGFVLEPCVWQPEGDWAGRIGTPVEATRDAVAAAVASGSPPDVYVSGPPALVDAVQGVCAQAGLAPEQVITERVLPT